MYYMDPNAEIFSASFKQNVPSILANGLSALLGEESKRIRERAERKQIRGRKIPKTVENTCHLASEPRQEGGHNPLSYTLKQAHQIIDASTKFADGLDAPAFCFHLKKKVREKMTRKDFVFFVVHFRSFYTSESTKRAHPSLC